MLNPMLQQLTSRQNSPMQANNPMQMIQQFANFKQQMVGKDPKAIVQNLLTSGKMSNQQFEQLKQQAQSLQSIFR